MLKQDNVNLKLLQNPSLDPTFLKSANEIIEQCRTKLSLITDPQVKIKLDHMIGLVASTLQKLPLNKQPDSNIKKYCADLRLFALSLPSEPEHRSNLATTSYAIAKACLFILAFSFAIVLGYAFQAWYFATLTLPILTNYLVNSLAFIGIPGLSMGLFARVVEHQQNTRSCKIIELQNKVAIFCNTAESIENSTGSAAKVHGL